MTHTGLAHLTRTHDHNRLFREVLCEDPFGQFSRYTADGCGPAPNSGARADLLHDLEGILKNAVQDTTGEPRTAGHLIGLFDLARNFCFAKHHRIQAGSNSEQMARGLSVFVEISVGAQIARISEKKLEQRTGAIQLAPRRRVDFDAVA